MNIDEISNLVINGATFLDKFIEEHGPYVTNGNADTIEELSRVLIRYINIALMDGVIEQITDERSRNEFVDYLSTLKTNVEGNLEVVSKFRNQLWIEEHMMGC